MTQSRELLITDIGSAIAMTPRWNETFMHAINSLVATKAHEWGKSQCVVLIGWNYEEFLYNNLDGFEFCATYHVKFT